MSLIKKAGESFGSRVLVVAGAKSTGKTTFTTTGSKFAPSKLPTSPRVSCPDVVFIQNDTNGVLGPFAVGLEPNVVDLSDCQTMQEWDARFNAAFKELKAGFADKQYRILGIDLSALDKLWRDIFVAQAENDTPKNYELVTAKALALFRMLRGLPNMTLIGMTHVTVQAEIASKQDPSVLKRQQDARDAQAVGGERATITADLAKGFRGIWWANADAILAVRRKKVGEKAEYVVRVHPSNKLESGGRWESYFQAEEPAHLYTMLKKVYGENA